MRDLGSPVHSRKWLQAVLDSYGPRARCAVVYMPDGTPAAGGIVLCHDKTVSIPWASSLKEWNRWNPNMLLYWSFLEYAADNDYAWFDFGRSTPGEGTYRFKEQWGAEARPLHWMRIDPTSGLLSSPVGENPGGRTDGKARQYAEKVFQALPVPLATFVGSRIRRYISL